MRDGWAVKAAYVFHEKRKQEDDDVRVSKAENIRFSAKQEKKNNNHNATVQSSPKKNE